VARKIWVFTPREIGIPAGVLLAILLGQTGVARVGGREWLSIAGALFGGIPIYVAGAKAIASAVRKRSLVELNMGVLTSIAVFAAIAAGEDVAAAIVVLMMMGGIALEDAALRRAGSAVGDVMSLRPSQATRLDTDGVRTEVATEDLAVGDRVLVRSGERVPVDGVVEDGRAAVNQAPVTGEAMPVSREPGGAVFEGSLVEEGYLEMRAERVGSDATIARVHQLVEEARGLRSPFQRAADRFAAYFTPVLLLVAGVVWLWSGEPTRAVAVLVVFCPCSLVVAAPTAVFATVGRAAKDGLLVRGGEPLEIAAGIDTLVLDKTGTLTTGRATVDEVIAEEGVDSADLLRWTAGVESVSEHPLGRAIHEYALERGGAIPDVADATVHAGRGVAGRVEGKDVRVGSPRWLAEDGIELGEIAEDGRIVVGVAVDGRAAGRVHLRDPLRPGVAEMIGELRERGIDEIVVVTGDAEPAARAAASAAGIEDVRAGVLPEDKVRVVEELKARGRRVAVAGDGVNDGPALAAADLAVAMGRSGTDIALSLSGATLVDDRIDRLPELFDHGRRTVRVIRGNVWAAMTINLAGVVFGATGDMTPIMGALVHNLASVAVVLNSARLAWSGPRRAT